jgi:hypothetical protein
MNEEVIILFKIIFELLLYFMSGVRTYVQYLLAILSVRYVCTVGMY